MDLYKYSFNSLNEISASEDKVSFSIIGGRFTKHDGSKGSYLTPNGNFQNYPAQYKLSITSSPNFKYRIEAMDLNVLESKCKVLFLNNKHENIGPLKSLTLAKMPRVWPSFGYFGGARELFAKFESPNTLKINRTHKFKIPGKRDFFQQDDDEMLDLSSVESILKGTAAYYMNSNRSIENANAKIYGSSVSINITNFEGCGVNVTASVAFKSLLKDTFVKCWVTAWEDDEHNQKRYVYHFQNAEYFFANIDKKNLASDADFTQNIFLPLYDVLLKRIKTDGCPKSELFHINLI